MHSAKIAGKGLVLSAIAFSIAFLAENAGQLSEHLPESVHNWVTSLAVNYQRWSSGPRNLESRYAAIVALEQRSFPGMINESCGQRKIVTRLLPRLADAQASVIVIDLAFARDNCRPDSNQSITIQLQSSLNSVSDRIPVVIGQSSVDFSQVSEPERRALEAAGMLKDTLRLRPLFDSIPGSNTRIGLIRANKDVRRVPLEWPTFEPQSDGNVRYAGLRPSLSLQAARVVRNSFPGGLESIERFVTSGIHPYTTLMKPESFIRARASDLLCGTDVVQNACMPDTLRATREQLRGKVALVGWVDDSNDTHETPAGTMPGIFLQANYIESLLDGRLLHAVPLSWQFGLTLVWFVLIELPFHYWRENWKNALLTALLVWAMVSIVAYYVLVVNMGWYLALLPPSLIAILARGCYQWSEGKKRTTGRRTSQGKPGTCASVTPQPVASISRGS